MVCYIQSSISKSHLNFVHPSLLCCSLNLFSLTHDFTILHTVTEEHTATQILKVTAQCKRSNSYLHI